MRAIRDLEVLDALPVGSIIRHHGRFAARSPMGWLLADGSHWDPRVPVEHVDGTA